MGHDSKKDGSVGETCESGDGGKEWLRASSASALGGCEGMGGWSWREDV